MCEGISKKMFISDFSKCLKERNATLFIGSGISRNAQYAGWKDILKDCALSIGLDVDKESDLITLAEYYVRSRQRTKINITIKDFFDNKKGNITEIHRIIASLPLNDIWTTNYDTLIERSFDEAHKEYTVLTDDESYRNINSKAGIKIHKIHGTVDEPNKCIITRSDYEKFQLAHDIVLSELKGEMCSKSFLFMGYSFSDTDIQHILTKIRLTFDESHPINHYTIVEKVKKGIEEKEEDYIYRLKKQEYHIRDMRTYGIETLLVDSYDEIKDILIEIRRKVYEDNILISGSYEIDSEFSNNISSLVTKLSKELIMKNYKIITGYGKNLGKNIVVGAYEGLDETNKKFNENVSIFPFPYELNEELKVKKYNEIRLNMASISSIIIIIDGNNKNKEESGVYKEYELSKKQNNLVIPIPCFGQTAKQIYDELLLDTHYSNNEEFQNLNKETNVDKIINIILKLIKGE